MDDQSLDAESKTKTPSHRGRVRKVSKDAADSDMQTNSEKLAKWGSGDASHTFSQKKLELKLLHFVIRDQQPFSIVEGTGFIKMMKEVEPRFRIPDMKQVAAGVWDLFTVEKSKISEAIHDLRVSITTNTWTSVQDIDYMIVTAHFLDNDWKLHRQIINFAKITSHNGDDIGSVLEACLKNWGIEKVFSIMVDNAETNDGVVDYMKKRFGEMNTLLVGGKYLHLRCGSHILNLVVKSGLKKLRTSITAIRNCVKYIHSSAARLDKFREFAILFKMDKISNVPMDVETMWNSTYKMLDIASKYKTVFTMMAEENVEFKEYFDEMEMDENKRWVKRAGPPIETDWVKCSAFVQFLERIYKSTLKLSATKTITSNLLWEETVALKLDIEAKIGDSSDILLQEVAKSMKVKFDKYWGNLGTLNPIIFLGEVLNPCFKLSLLEISFEEMKVEDKIVDELIGAIKGCLYDLYDDYRANSEFNPSKEVVLQDDNALLNYCEGNLIRVKMHKALFQELAEKQLHKISNEVDRYFVAPFENPFREFDVLNWWKGNTTNYPILSSIAKDILAIPASTVSSENAFNLGKRVVDPFRASLTPEMVEALVCTSDWLRAEAFDFYKDPTDDMLEFYKEMEEVELQTCKL